MNKVWRWMRLVVLVVVVDDGFLAGRWRTWDILPAAWVVVGEWWRLGMVGDGGIVVWRKPGTRSRLQVIL